MKTAPEEKRHRPRINLRTPLRYQVRGRAESCETICDNIGIGGIGFIDERFIAPKTVVTLEINVLSRILRPTGKIAWVSAVPHSDRYKMGIEFLELAPDEKNYLADYINMHTGNM